MSDAADRQILLSRLVDAPRSLVWRAWTDPKHVGQWWGPDGFRNTIHEMDLRPGGVWRFVMHGPDGTDYPNKIVFREVKEPERLAYDHMSDGGEGTAPEIRFQVLVSFETEGTGTRVTMRSTFPSAEARDYVVREFGAIEGGKQHLGRLADYLKTMA